ncbi:hypothetical protein [Plesiomonas shigelloides]|uniref:hypothetical protein n=1 Tax=Plesiomonas shigelloides TaxID=703 RepID=UPI0012627AAF|nr:hypothetical protein [Plesiomonas shigelloides]KAB7692229.1 hypothetical protein GBN20_02295 [Plesiomonas shigelloides]
MLRAIGHILRNVDAKQYNEQFSAVLQSKYNHWRKNEPIFRDFIEKERNEILKEYVSSIDIESVTKKRRLVTSNGLRLVTNSGQQLSVNITMKELVKNKGHLAGETPIKVLNNALNWWDKELSELECLTRSKTIAK